MKLTKEQKQKLAANKPKSKNQYIDNAEFLALIVKHKKDCKAALKAKKPKPKIPDKVGKCLLLIAGNMLNKSWFMGYTQLFKEEMLGDAIENCIMYFDNFDIKKSKNPFAYYSQICYYAFKRRIEREKKHLYTKYKVVQQSGVLDELQNHVEGDGDEEFQQDVQTYSNLDEFVKKYEAELKASRQKTTANTTLPEQAKTV